VDRHVDLAMKLAGEAGEERIDSILNLDPMIRRPP
jgi:hypothetical protein